MGSWRQDVQRLVSREQPDISVRGMGRRNGVDDGTFRAVYCEGTWAVTGPAGLCLVADAHGEVVPEEGVWEVHAAGGGWKYTHPSRLAGTLVALERPDAGIETARVLDGPADAMVAGRPARRYVILYPGKRAPVTIWADRQLPLLLRVQAGDARYAAEPSSPDMVQVVHLAEVTPEEREEMRRHREHLTQIRERRLAESHGIITDENRARTLAAHVVKAFGPGARLEEILAFDADGGFLFKLSIDGEPVFVARHHLEEHYRAFLGEMYRFGFEQDPWDYTFDHRGVLSQNRLHAAARAMSRSRAFIQ